MSASINGLRDYSNYLTPKLGLFSADSWTAYATILRNLPLNWLVLIPLIVVSFMVPRLQILVLGSSWESVTACHLLVLSLVLVIPSLTYLHLYGPILCRLREEKRNKEEEDKRTSNRLHCLSPRIHW
jgi:hypothetical protein